MWTFHTLSLYQNYLLLQCCIHICWYRIQHFSIDIFSNSAKHANSSRFAFFNRILITHLLKINTARLLHCCNNRAHSTSYLTSGLQAICLLSPTLRCTVLRWHYQFFKEYHAFFVMSNSFNHCICNNPLTNYTLINLE